MRTRTFIHLTVVAAALLATATPALGQAGLRTPSAPEEVMRFWPGVSRLEMGINPEFAAGAWREAVGFAPSRRLQWSYALGDAGSLGLSLANTRELHYSAFPSEPRQFMLFGRYSLAGEWAISAEAGGRDPGGLLRLNDFRIGVGRRF